MLHDLNQHDIWLLVWCRTECVIMGTTMLPIMVSFDTTLSTELWRCQSQDHPLTMCLRYTPNLRTILHHNSCSMLLNILRLICRRSFCNVLNYFDLFLRLIIVRTYIGLYYYLIILAGVSGGGPLAVLVNLFELRKELLVLSSSHFRLFDIKWA